MKKIFLFTTECSSGGIEREYIAEFFVFVSINYNLRKGVDYDFISITNKKTDCPEKAFEAFAEYFKKNKKEIKNFHIIPYVIIDKDNDRKFSEALRQKYIKQGIHLFISNRSFEQWIEFHSSNNEISNLNGLGNNNKKAYKKSVSNIMNGDSIKTAYNHAKNRCLSAGDDISNPYCLNYTGSDMFAFIDLIQNELNIKII